MRVALLGQGQDAPHTFLILRKLSTKEGKDGVAYYLTYRSQFYERAIPPNIQPICIQTSTGASVSCYEHCTTRFFWDSVLTFSRRNTYDKHVFAERPLLGPLLFDNNDSDARDHCAAERSTKILSKCYDVPQTDNLHSIPLMASSSDLHGNRLRRNSNFLSSKEPSLDTREADRSTIRPRLLAPSHRVSGRRSKQLHQDREPLLTKASTRAERDGNAVSLHSGGNGDHSRLRAFLINEFGGREYIEVVLDTRKSDQASGRMLLLICKPRKKPQHVYFFRLGRAFFSFFF